jgi:hypothetical protein
MSIYQYACFYFKMYYKSYRQSKIKEFIKIVTAAGKTKPPNLPKNAVKPESKI